MRVYHPPTVYQGVAPDDVFLVADSFNRKVGEGMILRTYQPYLFPERPINLFMTMEATGAVLDTLLGALMARALQLRADTPNLLTRLYTQVSVDDEARISYLSAAGFDLTDAEDYVLLQKPVGAKSTLMGYEIRPVPLADYASQSAFILRLNACRLQAFTLEMLGQCMGMPHFLALGIYGSNPDPVGEILLCGQGESASVVGLYVMPDYRRQGMAKALLANAIDQLVEKGVTRIQAVVLRRNAPQSALARACDATLIRTACYYPGIDMD